MDSFTDELNAWFNAVRLEDSHDYSSASLVYLEDAGRCLSRNILVRAAMSTSCAASCLATMGDTEDALKLYSAAATLYEYNADLSIGKSMRESLWSLLHSFEYFTLVSDLVSAERTSKKYADLARRVDRFETRNVFEVLKNRRENVLVERSNLSSPPVAIPVKNIPDINKIHRSMKSFLQQVQAVISKAYDSSFAEEEEIEQARTLGEEDDESLIYETESDLNERRIVS